MSQIRDWVLIAARAADEKKAADIMAIEVGDLLVVTDYFVIATGATPIQVRAIADEIEDQLREQAGIKPIGREGLSEGKWVLLDYADLVVHVFQPAEREFYRLEKLWGDAPRVALPADIEGRASFAKGAPGARNTEDDASEDAAAAEQR